MPWSAPQTRSTNVATSSAATATPHPTLQFEMFARAQALVRAAAAASASWRDGASSGASSRRGRTSTANVGPVVLAGTHEREAWHRDGVEGVVGGLHERLAQEGAAFGDVH